MLEIRSQRDDEKLFPPTLALSPRAIYTQDLHDHLGRRSEDRIDGGKKKITKSYLIQRLNPLSGGLISPKDISVPLKGSPDLNEEGYVGEGARREEAEGDPESQQGERDGRKKEREEGLL